MRRGHIAAVGALLVALAGLVGCAGDMGDSADECLPRFEVEPQTASPGEVIVLSSDTECDAPLPKQGWKVVASPVGEEGRGIHTTTDQLFDGSFRVELELPGDFRSGQAWAGITNWDHSPCSDHGACASASADFTVE